MADHSPSTPVPDAHGPVTAAIRALVAEFGPRPSNVVRLGRLPSFTPIAFSFPLNDSLFGAVYLRAVRFAVGFVALPGRAAVEKCLEVRRQCPGGAVATAGQVALAIDHFEELLELLRTAQSRLREADAVAAQIQAAEVRQ